MSKRRAVPRATPREEKGAAGGATSPPDSTLGVVREATPPETRESAPAFVSGFKRCPACSQRYPADFRVCPLDATELEAPPEDGDPLLGSTLGDTYEILRVIGEGGMGRVYEARHRRLASRRFAVKVLHADLTRQPDIVGRFLREAEATSVLNHVNVVAVIDVNRAPDGRPYIVAELLEGEQLADYLERTKTLSVSEAVNICRQVCSALVAAHARDIVHRDIKPENVFLIDQGGRRTVKVLDFGISRLGEGATSLTKTGIVMGTPAYMPPEQARGIKVDHRADIYAVGAILYEAVTGRPPFDDSDMMATLAKVLSEEPVRPCTINTGLPPALEMTIQRAMAKDPAQRHRTMLELDAELAGFDTGQPAPPPAAHEELPTTPLETLRASLIHGDPTQTGRHSRLIGVSAQKARSSIIMLSFVALAWIACGLLDAATSGIRWARGSGMLSATELVLTFASAFAILLAPGLAWFRHVKHGVWPSTPRAVELVSELRGVLVAVFVTYAAGNLAVRVVEGVFHDDPKALGWPGWSVFLFVASNIAGAVTWWLERKRRAAEQ